MMPLTLHISFWMAQKNLPPSLAHSLSLAPSLSRSLALSLTHLSSFSHELPPPFSLTALTALSLSLSLSYFLAVILCYATAFSCAHSDSLLPLYALPMLTYVLLLLLSLFYKLPRLSPSSPSRALSLTLAHSHILSHSPIINN